VVWILAVVILVAATFAVSTFVFFGLAAEVPTVFLTTAMVFLLEVDGDFDPPLSMHLACQTLAARNFLNTAENLAKSMRIGSRAARERVLWVKNYPRPGELLTRNLQR
jgi:hypothetical protein